MWLFKRKYQSTGSPVWNLYIYRSLSKETYFVIVLESEQQKNLASCEEIFLLAGTRLLYNYLQIKLKWVNILTVFYQYTD